MDNRYSMAYGMGFDLLEALGSDEPECDCQEELDEYCEFCAGE